MDERVATGRALGILAHSCPPLFWRIRHSLIPQYQSMLTRGLGKDKRDNVDIATT